MVDKLMDKKLLLHLYCYLNQGQLSVGPLQPVAVGDDHHKDSEGVEDLRKKGGTRDAVLVHQYAVDVGPIAQIAPVENQLLFQIMFRG